MKKAVCTLIFIFCFIGPEAFAQNNPCQKELIEICQSPQAEINKTTIKCLYDNLKKTSRLCHDSLPTIALKEGECILETIAYCSPGKVPTDHLENIICLEKNRSKFLRPCLKKLDEVKAVGQKKFDDTLASYAQGCKNEYAECGNPKDPEAAACVSAKFKANKVSAECRKVILESFEARKKK